MLSASTPDSTISASAARRISAAVNDPLERFVTVDTAGAKADIVFEYVPNPEIIQGDIFQRLDDFRRQQRINEGSARRQEYALLIDVYRQAMEQQRIPPRTPLGYSEEENQQAP